MQCWNCGAAPGEGFRFCPRCGEPVSPDPDEAHKRAGNIDYLLKEITRWAWLNEFRRGQLKTDYERRKFQLLNPGAAIPAPPPPPVAEPPKVTVPASEPEPAAEEERPNPLSGFLEESNIRWFHTLGGLLIIAACIGVLRSPWAGVAKPILAVLMLASPLGCFAMAGRLRESLPMSSRLLTLLGGLLFPSGLLALNAFLLHLPATAWNSLSFFLGAALFARLARQRQDPACLYLGALSAALCGISLGAPGGGLALLLAASTLVVWARQGSDLAHHLKGLSQGLVGLALLLSIPTLQKGEAQAAALFFLGTLFFLSAAFLWEDAATLTTSAWLGLATCAVGVFTMKLTVLAAGYGVVAMGAGYLTLAQRLKGTPMAATAYRLGTWLSGTALAGVLGWELVLGATDNFARYTPSELLSACIVSLLAGCVYAAQAYLHRRPGLLYGACAAFAYCYWMCIVLVLRTTPGTYSLALAGLPTLWILVAWGLRRAVPERYLGPLVESTLALALLPGLLALSLHGLGVAPSPQPWVFLVCGGVNLLASLWLRRAWPLYLALGWMALGYGFAWPLLAAGQAPPRELYFLPLVAGMMLAAWQVDRQSREFATPIALMGLALSLGVGVFAGVRALTQPGPMPALTLALLGLGYALAARLFRGWHQAPLALTFLTSLALGSACLAYDLTAFGPLVGVLAVLVVIALALDLPGLLWGALCLTPAAIFLGDPAAVRVAAAGLWLLPAYRGGNVFVVASHVLLGYSAPNSELMLAHAAVTLGVAWTRGSAVAAGGSWIVGGLALFGLTEDLNGALWLLPWLAYNAAWEALSRRLPVARSLSILTAGVVLCAVMLEGLVPSSVAYAVYAAVFMVLGRRHDGWLSLGALCAVGSASWLALYFKAPAAMAAAWVIAGAVLPRGAWSRWLSIGLLIGSTAMGALLGTGDSADYAASLVILGLTAAAGWRHSAWLSFAPAYVAYLQTGVSGVILTNLPLGLAFLIASHRSRPHRDLCGGLGLAFLLAPPLLVSLGPQPLAAAMWVLAAGLGLAFLGVGHRRRDLLLGGSAAVLLELIIRVFGFASLLPWQLVVTVAGVSLVALGVVFERKRVEVLAASRRLLDQLSSW